MIDTTTSSQIRTPFRFQPFEDRDQQRQHLIKTFGVDHLMMMGKTYPVEALTCTGAYSDGDDPDAIVFWTTKLPLALLVAVISVSATRGAARALIDHVRSESKLLGAKRLRALTTNDNMAALKFYQLYGFRLNSIFVGALDMMRVLHPTLPKLGHDNIPRRDTIELELDL